MKVLKYTGGKIGGMPVTFPVGSKSKSSVTHHVKANPYIELQDEEAEKVLELEEARCKESGAYMREIRNEKDEVVKLVKTYEKPATSPQFEEVAADDADYLAWKAGAPKPKKAKAAEEKPAKAAKKAKAAKASDET